MGTLLGEKKIRKKKKTLYFLTKYYLTFYQSIALQKTFHQDCELLNCYSLCVNTKRVMQPEEPRSELSTGNANTGTTNKLEKPENGILKSRTVASLAA